jgi:hypothetical protein
MARYTGCSCIPRKKVRVWTPRAARRRAVVMFLLA